MIETALTSGFTAVGVDVFLLGPVPTPGVAMLTRSMRADLAPDPLLPDDTRLWAALQAASGGTWAGCVYDADAIIKALRGK